MTEKQRTLLWLIEHNKHGEDAPFLADFEKGLTQAINEDDEIITTWLFGNLFFTDENFYKIRWNLGKAVIEKISQKEADSNDLGERSIITLKKDLFSPKPVTDAYTPEEEKDAYEEEEEIFDPEEPTKTVWFQEIEAVYQTFTLIIDDRFSPGTKKEIDNAKWEVMRLKREYGGNPDFDKEIAFLDELLIEQGKRKFNGSWFTIIGVFLGILVMFYMSNKVEVESVSYTIDQAEAKQQDKIVKLGRQSDNAKDEIEYSKAAYIALQKEIEELEDQEQTNQIKERLDAKEKNLASFEENNEIRETTISEAAKEIKFLESMTAEEYRDFKIDNDQDAADSVSGYAWRTIFWFLLYLAAMFPFVFTINKRGEKNKASKWFAVIAVILGSGQTIRYRRSDGSTYDDNSGHVAAMAMAIALPVAAIALTIVLLPYIAIFVFARNIMVPYFF